VAKGSQLKNCSYRFNLGVRKPKKYIKQPLHHHMLFKWISRKKKTKRKKTPGSLKNNLWHIQLSDTILTLNGTGFYGEMKHTKI